MKRVFGSVVHENNFGKLIYEKQGNEDVVIVCIEISGKLKPLNLLLPHQIYKDSIEKIIDKYGTEKIVVIPAKTTDYSYLIELPVEHSEEIENELVYQRWSDEDVVIVCVYPPFRGDLKLLKVISADKVYKKDIKTIIKEYSSNRLILIPARKKDFAYLQEHF